MQEPQLHEQEEKRLDVLHKRALLDRANDTHFRDILEEAREKLHSAISTVTLIDKDKEVYVSCVGTDSRGGPRNQSFCGHALVSVDVLVCEDTHEDERFRDNPYVTGPPFLRFYMGTKLFDKASGLPLGVFCVKDSVARKVSIEDMATFMELGERCQKVLDTL